MTDERIKEIEQNAKIRMPKRYECYGSLFVCDWISAAQRDRDELISEIKKLRKICSHVDR